jgi:hypothetical protein
MFGFANGEEFPDADCFDDESLAYLRQRFNTSASKPVKTRYSHILWGHPKSRHRDHAAAAIDAYLESAHACADILSKPSDRGVVLAEVEALIAALKLSLSAGVKTDEVLATIDSVSDAPTFNPNDRWTIRSFVSRDICEMKFPRRVEFLRGMLEKLGAEFDEYAQTAGPFVPHDIAKIAVEMCRVSQLPDKIWLVRRANAALANSRAMGKDNTASLSWIHDAIQDFEAAGEREAANTWLREYEQRSGNVHYGVISTEIDMSGTYRQFDDIAKKLIQGGVVAIFEYLAQTGDLLIPNVAGIREQARKLCESSPILGMATHVIQDKLGRPAKEFSGPEGSLEHWTLWYYSNYVSAYTLELLKRIFVFAIQDGVLTSAKLQEWLEGGSWLGAKLTRPVGNYETISFTWADVIVPSFEHYENELRRYLSTKTELPKLMLSIDSLTTKIEGIVRDLIGFLGSTPTEAKQKGKQRTIESRSLDKLLEDKMLLDHLGEDNVFFIRFVLSEKAGWNLRAEVAHSLLSPREYRVQMFHLLLLIVFRLSRFSLVATVGKTE